MTVSRLITILENCPAEAKVFIDYVKKDKTIYNLSINNITCFMAENDAENGIDSTAFIRVEEPALSSIKEHKGDCC